ncbi:MAG: ion channel [Pseudomonadales bacterium]
MTKYRCQFILGVVLALPTFGLNWSEALFDSTVYFYLVNLSQIVFFAYILVVLIDYVLSRQLVILDIIFAVMCAYLILVSAWMFVYSCIELSIPDSFSLPETEGYQAQLQEFLYYSFVTLSTLGYGDITPLTSYAKSWSIIEAIIGQFYLAIVLARLVGLRISSCN